MDRFPESARGALGGLWHHAARTGAVTAGDIIRRVVVDATSAAASPYCSPERRSTLRLLLAAIRDDAAGAEAYARHVLAWNALPSEQRQQIKQQRGAEARLRWMEAQPATEPQLKYLQALGHHGPVANRAEASRLIDALRQQQVRQ